jgi:hypothetical protein
MTLEAGNKTGFLLGFRGYDRINFQSIRLRLGITRFEFGEFGGFGFGGFGGGTSRLS